MNKQTIYKIRFYKDFEFPSFSIDKNNTLADLHNKSIEEVKENINNENIDSYFNTEVTSILPFEIKINIPNFQIDSIPKDISYFIREFALADLEEKYGPLDFEKNPNIFDKRTKNKYGYIIENSPYVLKNNIENFYIERVEKYLNIYNIKSV